MEFEFWHRVFPFLWLLSNGADGVIGGATSFQIRIRKKRFLKRLSQEPFKGHNR